MKKQEFNRGDHVRLNSKFGPSMSHFSGAGCDGIIIGSYKDQYGGSNTGSYTVHIKGIGLASWYNDYDMKLIEKNRQDILVLWEEEEKKEDEMHSDFDWIFNGEDSRAHELPGVSVQRLASEMGFGSLWGSYGEGITYYKNSMVIMAMCKPFLESGDKNGFIKFSSDFKEKIKNGETK